MKRITAPKNTHQEAEQLALTAKDWRALGEIFFQACDENTTTSPCVFVRIMHLLPPDEWREFDRAYCLRKRPQDKDLLDYLDNIRKQEERRKEYECLLKRRAELMRKLENSSGK